MNQILTLIFSVFGFLVLLGFGAFGLISRSEGERRATRVAFGVAILGAATLWGVAALSISVKLVALGVAITLGAAFVVLFFLPIGRVSIGNDIPEKRFDEREIMFARAGLEPGTLEYEAYYAMHPEHEAGDSNTRSKPGLLSPEAKLANAFHFASVNGSFGLTKALRGAVDGPVSDVQHALPPEKMTAYLKDLARYYGAMDAGVTELKPYHLYSHIGRGTGVYGSPISIEHRFAIAFTVEMDFSMMGASPYPPLSMESGKQYVEIARVAVQLANTIRELGYSARAHINGNYQVIAPLVARDAGLGEIGRMTILMTPRQGPRVRVGVVTTDVTLIPDPRGPVSAVIDFCNICGKCADVCPSRSIPVGEREEIDGALRWKLNPDTCFRYWSVIGTDCGRCMAVCPFSHPDTLSHNLIRWGIAKSGFFRRVALWMDDIFYGKEPAPSAAPEWTRVP